jgi:hypothetical protein
MMRGKSDIQVELESISKEVSEIPVKQVFTVPEGYFDLLPGLILEKIRAMEVGHEEEISSLSPLLAGMSRKMPMNVPEGYFSEVRIPSATGAKTPAPIVSMPKNRFRLYAVAASLVAILGFGALIYNMSEQQGNMDPLSVSKELPKVSEKEMDEFLSGFPDITVPEPIVVAGNPAEAEEMMRDIDEECLKDFLSDQPEITPQKLN